LNTHRSITITIAEDGHVGTPSGEILAVAKVAVEQLLAARVAATRGVPKTNPWRFSGRTWGGPVSQRRERPTR
jgi:hypothetical protein